MSHRSVLGRHFLFCLSSILLLVPNEGDCYYSAAPRSPNPNVKERDRGGLLSNFGSLPNADLVGDS
jgi:hypothetical protein